MLIPMINFNKSCNEAISFYKDVLGAEVKSISYAKDAPPDSGMDDYPPDFVMHSEVFICGTNLSLTDGGENSLPFGNFSFMLMYDTAEEVTEIFNKLVEVGKVDWPLEPAFYSSLQGSVVDRFGVNWLVMVKHP